MKSAAWYYKFPGMFYAYGPARFNKPVTEKEARKHIRKIWDMRHYCPRGMELWPA